MASSRDAGKHPTVHVTPPTPLPAQDSPAPNVSSAGTEGLGLT